MTYNMCMNLKDTYIYPHSVTINAEPVRCKEIYNDFYKNNIFSYYLEICSEKPSSDYIVELAILSLDNKEKILKTLFFNSLDSKEFEYFINSVNLIFLPFKKSILNFEKHSYSFKEYYDIIRNWIKNNKDFSVSNIYNI